MMLRLLFPSITLLLSASASAGQPDCSTFQISSNGLVVYRDVEVFPNPTKTTQLSLAEQTKPLKQTICGVTLSADTQSYSFQAKSIVQLSKVMDGNGLGWTLHPMGRVNSKYFDVANINIALPDGLLRHDVAITGYPLGPFLNEKSLMALRVNGGPLQPLLYNGKFREIRLDPKPVALLELFVKDDKAMLWQKMALDVRNSKMTFTKKAAFPAK